MTPQLKYFTREGSLYRMKRQYSFALIISVVFILIAMAGIYGHKPAVTWIFGGLALLFLITIWNDSLVVDVQAKQIVIKRGLIAGPVTIPLDTLLQFELHRVSYNLVPVNTSLNARYFMAGKEKTILVAQGFTKLAMQRVLNEIEEIIAQDANYGKI